MGLRLGAMLSIMAGAERGDIDGLVLWNPFITGKAYVEELKIMHSEMLKYSYVKPQYSKSSSRLVEVFGFPFTDLMLSDFEKIDLLSIKEKSAKNIFLLESNEKAREARLKPHLTNPDIRLEYQYIPSPEIWLEEPHKGLVPHQLLQSVVSWVSKVYS